MSAIWAWLVVLADRSQWERLGDGVSGRNAQLSVDELLVLVAIAGAGVLLIIWLKGLLRRQDPTRTCNKPKQLFAQLCKEHRLTSQYRQVLAELAKSLQFPNPAEIFLRPEAFNVATLPPQLRPDADRVFILREKLFAEPGGR